MNEKRGEVQYAGSSIQKHKFNSPWQKLCHLHPTASLTIIMPGVAVLKYCAKAFRPNDAPTQYLLETHHSVLDDYKYYSLIAQKRTTQISLYCCMRVLRFIELLSLFPPREGVTIGLDLDPVLVISF
jgi:hypothetical protein